MRTNQRWRYALALSAAMALVACGGGSSKPPDTTPPPAPERPTAMQWQMTSLAEASVALVPGGGYGLDTPSAPTVDWLGFNSGTNLLDAQSASYSAGSWQVAPTSSMTGLPTGLAYTPFHVSKAGAWTVFRAILGGTLYARFDGPNGVSSGFVPVSTVANSIGWAAVDASGVARLYWPDNTGPNTVVTRTGHFTGTTWVDDGLEPGMSLYADAVAAGADGQGWLFYSYIGPYATQDQFVRHVDAVNGLGAEVRLDDPALGFSVSTRKAAAESSTAVTTVARQASVSAVCLAVRRFAAGAWSGAQCVNQLPTPATVGETYEVAANASGRALVAWRDDTGRLYASVRRVDGGWGGARLVAAMPAGEVLSDIYPSVDGSGNSIVVYRTTLIASPSRLRAVVYKEATESWGASELVDATDGSAYPRVSVAFNAQGEPGVLSFARTGSGDFEVHVSTRVDGAWSTAATPAVFATRPTFPYDITTIQRLIPFGTRGWAAFWEVSSPVGGGARRLMMATYQ